MSGLRLGAVQRATNPGRRRSGPILHSVMVGMRRLPAIIPAIDARLAGRTNEQIAAAAWVVRPYPIGSPRSWVLPCPGDAASPAAGDRSPCDPQTRLPG